MYIISRINVYTSYLPFQASYAASAAYTAAAARSYAAAAAAAQPVASYAAVTG